MPATDPQPEPAPAADHKLEPPPSPEPEPATVSTPELEPVTAPEAGANRHLSGQINKSASERQFIDESVEEH